MVLLGLVLLVAGGESLVKGAAALAARFGLSSLVVGLTIVALATSAPELAVSMGAVLGGQPELAVGNVVGSNIANVLLVLGAAAVLAPLLVQRNFVRFDLPFILVVSVLLLALGLDGDLGRLDGCLLLALLVTHMVLAVRRGRRTADPVAAENAPGIPQVAVSRSGLQVALGVVLLVGGSQALVSGAVGIATYLGVSELVIGLTVVAIGTSLPELAASMVAVGRGQRDLAIGNVVGSNIANLGLVLGLPAAAFGDLPVPDAALALDIPVMVAVAVMLVPVAYTGYVVHRPEGALFVALYLAYTAYVLLDSTGHDARAGFAVVLLWVLPVVAVVLVADAVLEFVRRRTRAGMPRS